MPIEFRCPSCDQTLRVGDELAGRQARCPTCQTVFAVPQQPAGAAAFGDDQSPSPQAAVRWYVKSADGQHYGPVERAVLDGWAADERITANCQVLEEGSSQWRWASDVFPHLGGGTVHGMPASAASANPYRSPSNYGAGLGGSNGGSYTMPHRGVLVLIFGILGLVVCGPLGIAAWVMGRSDLNDMKHGRMDPAGQGMTTAGMVLGIISVVIMVSGCCFVVLAGIAGG